MQPTSPDIQTVSEIASEFLREKVTAARPLRKGSNNKNFFVETESNRIVVKLSHEHKEYKALQDYIKEKWCIEKSAAVGVPGPTVLAVGQAGSNAYMLETFVPGENGEDIAGDKTGIWREMGRYAKSIHSIEVVGFGEDLLDPERGAFKDSWNRFIDYNVESLTGNDKLIELDVLTSTQSEKVRAVFEELKARSFDFGLNHGDLALWNTLVEPSGKVNLLDWGSAEAHIVPHFDFIHVLGCHRELDDPDNAELQAFFDGYGISQVALKRLEPELYSLMLLKVIDKLRWALDQNSSKVPEFTARVKETLRLKLKTTEVEPR